jgi:hypothetical protein
MFNYLSFALFSSYHYLPCNTRVILFSGSSTSHFSPSSPRRGSIPNVPISVASEAPEAEDSQHGVEGGDSLERTSSTMLPPPALSEDIVIGKKRKRAKEFTSSSASAHKTAAGETPAPQDDVELFDLMES